MYEMNLSLGEQNTKNCSNNSRNVIPADDMIAVIKSHVDLLNKDPT